MHIIPAPEVSQEIKQLQVEKAAMLDEFHRLSTDVREKQKALTDLMVREKAFQDSFVGNSEWLKKITELRDQYVKETDKYGALLQQKRDLEAELPGIKGVIKDTQQILTNLRQDKLLLEDRLKTARAQIDEINGAVQAKQIELSELHTEISKIKVEKADFDEDFARKMQAMSEREQLLSKKELNLKVYEDRLVREYAILFPDVRINP